MEFKSSKMYLALLMYFFMVIAQSFLARTFGSYTLELGDRSFYAPLLGVGLLLLQGLVAVALVLDIAPSSISIASLIFLFATRFSACTITNKNIAVKILI